MGGHVAGLYATEYPEHLKSLILVCPHGIYFEKQQQMIDEAINNQNFVLLPQTLDEIKHMFDMVMHRRPKIRDIFMCGILQIRLEKDLFYRKRKYYIGCFLIKSCDWYLLYCIFLCVYLSAES